MKGNFYLIVKILFGITSFMIVPLAILAFPIGFYILRAGSFLGIVFLPPMISSLFLLIAPFSPLSRSSVLIYGIIAQVLALPALAFYFAVAGVASGISLSAIVIIFSVLVDYDFSSK